MRPSYALLVCFAWGGCASAHEAPTPPVPPPPAPVAAPKPIAGLSAPSAPTSAPGSIRGRASAEAAAPYQQCTADDQCTIVVNGCCEPGGAEPGIGIRRDQVPAFKALFACQGTVCRNSNLIGCDPAEPCQGDHCTLAELAGCKPTASPVARCASERCFYEGPY